jgi:5'-nucleotidase
MTTSKIKFSLKSTLLPILLLTIGSLSSCQSGEKNSDQEVTKITILQTADIHGQLLPHQEFFIENDSFVFKERGGIANIQTIFKQIKAENPEGTIILDGGDMIQGSAIAALSKGEAFGPIVAAME